MNPINFYEKEELPPEITDTYFIAMTCSDEEIRKRLKARAVERNCGSDEFIQTQIEYSAWFKKNQGVPTGFEGIVYMKPMDFVAFFWQGE